MAIVCDKLGVDVWEVIDAAATKPFGFMKFTPGPGIGGHCIPLDPHYLAWKMRTLNYKTRFIDLASEINCADARVRGRARWRTRSTTQRKAVNGSRILVLGVAYKRDIDDMRESPALDVIRLLEERGAMVALPRSVRRVDSARTGTRMHGVDLTDRVLAASRRRGDRDRPPQRRLPARDGSRVADRRHAQRHDAARSGRKARVRHRCAASRPPVDDAPRARAASHEDLRRRNRLRRPRRRRVLRRDRQRRRLRRRRRDEDRRACSRTCSRSTSPGSSDSSSATRPQGRLRFTTDVAGGDRDGRGRLHRRRHAAGRGRLRRPARTCSTSPTRSAST